MARIRSIKPEIREDEKVTSWPIPLRYFWVLLWGYVDDHGVGKYNPRLIKADTFPVDDDITADTVTGWLETLVEADVIRTFVDNGIDYFVVTNWTKHQKVQHAGKSRHPAPPEGLMRTSGESHETLTPEQGGGAGNREGEKSHETSTTPQPVDNPLVCPRHPYGTDKPCTKCREVRLATTHSSKTDRARATLALGAELAAEEDAKAIRRADPIRFLTATELGYCKHKVPAADCWICDEERQKAAKAVPA